MWITRCSEWKVFPVVLFAKHRYKLYLPKFMCARVDAESCKPGLDWTLATGVVFLRCVAMIPKYLKKKKKKKIAGGNVGSINNLQILFVQKEMEVQRSA